MRLRRFHVLRVFEAIAGRFLSGRPAGVKPGAALAAFRRAWR